MYDSSLKVLLIEDNPGDARLIRETLKKTNTARYEMKWVDRLSPGLMQLDREAIDVVLLDLSLPDSHGLETLERTLSQSKEVPIVVLTGLNDEELAIHALRNGAQDYLNKSDVNSTLLGRSIRHAIERKRAELALQRAHDTLEERVRDRTDAFVKQNKKLLIEIEERRHAENLYQTLAEKSMAGVYIVQDKIFRYLNSNAAAYAGYTPEELIGKEACCIVHPEDRKWVKLRAGQMLKGEREAPYEFRIQTRDGRERWILETVTSTAYEGKPAILGNSMDVTDMKKAEVGVRESHRLLTNIISFLPDAMLIIDQNGRVLAWNRSMEELTGVKAKDMVGLDNYEYAIPFYGERRPILIDLALKADRDIENKYSFIQKEKDLLVAETDVPCVMGENRILWGKAAPIRNTNGEIVGAIETIRDVTSRKKAEEKLQESEETLRSIVENIGIGISLISPDMEILALNKQMREWFPAVDVAERPLCYRSFNDPPRDEICSFCPTKAALRDGEVHEVLTETPAGDTIRNYRILASPIKDTNGNVTAAIEMVEDITENLELQERLVLSEKLYETVFETTGAGTVIVEDDMTLSLVNEEFARISGYRKEDIRGRSWTEFVAEKDREMMKTYHRQRRVDPQAVPSTYECTLIDKHRNEKDMLMNVSLIPGTKKSIASFLDITEQRRLARELEDSLRKYRLLADNVSDIIWTMDTDLRFTYISPSVKRLRGYSVEEALNQTVEEIMTPASLEIAMETFAEQQAIETMEGKDSTRTKKLELELTCKDGSTIWCEVNMTGLRDSDGQVYVILGVTRDITDRVRAYRALEESNEALEIKTQSLEASNTALRVLFDQVEKNRQELQWDVLYNVKQLITPYVEKLRTCRTDSDRDTCLQVLQTNLDNIISPFLRNMTLNHYKLTPKECQVANLVKEGKTNKEMADLLHLSIRSVEFHRDNIREKFGLKNKKANLQSFLSSLK